ncbi:MAG TPA: hypothetical protein VM118_14990 [Acidobacteriota bacterium]|nr:hypothetical protein [Acidobacteriota bacterium]
MDVMLDTTFWSDVGLTVASRLALVALALWSLKMIRGREPARAPASTSAHDRRAVVGAPPVNRVRPLIARVAQTAPKTARTTAAADRPSRDRMRRELLAYLEQRSTGRVDR